MNSSGAFYSYTEAHSEPGQTSKLEHLSWMEHSVLNTPLLQMIKASYSPNSVKDTVM